MNPKTDLNHTKKRKKQTEMDFNVTKEKQEIFG